jgi:hypothetical protein
MVQRGPHPVAPHPASLVGWLLLVPDVLCDAISVVAEFMVSASGLAGGLAASSA